MCRLISCPQGEAGLGRVAPGASQGWGSERPDPGCDPCSLQQLFPSGGSIRGCIKGIKALGKYVDLKRLNTTGVSSGCTADLLVSHPPAARVHTDLLGRGRHSRLPSPQVGRTMTFYGHGFLPLALPEVPPLTGDVYSGIGFRSTQDNGLLYHRASLVRPPCLPSCGPPWASSCPV